ncbi:MAG: hypothetical protein J6U57_10660 [Bacteroidales bacterium]|nr:hypothetical protein [Bacteroidales bacterium]
MQYKLKNPVDIGGKKLETVEIKEEWNVGDFIKIQDAGNGEGSRGLCQVAIAIDQPELIVKTFALDDYLEILKASTGFFMKHMKKAKASI